MKFSPAKKYIDVLFIFLSFAGRVDSAWCDSAKAAVVAVASTIQAGSSQGVSPKTLREAYAAAIHRSETVGIQEELLVQAHEGNMQAVGAVMPTVSSSFTFLQQETPRTPTGATIFPASQNTGKLTLDQPLFRGLRDFAALRQKKLLVHAQVGAYINAAKQLFYDLSTAYYNVLAHERDELNYRIEIELNQKRLVELESFFKIGRSQLTDVLTFKANIASLEAQLEITRGQLETSKEVLAYLTGWPRETELKDAEILFSAPPSLSGAADSSSPGESAAASKVLAHPGDVQSYLSLIDNRPDVRSALDNVKANDEGIPIAWGAHLPSVDLLGDYYFFRPGAISDVSWDVSLAVTFPLFQGGVVQSQVRQATSVSRQYSLILSQTRRLAEQEIRTYYDAVEADRKQVVKLTDLVEISKKNYETELEYYRRGLVTNLDVFQAMTTYQDAVRQLDHVRIQYQSDGVKLLASTSQRPEVNEIKAPTL